MNNSEEYLEVERVVFDEIDLLAYNNLEDLSKAVQSWIDAGYYICLGYVMQKRKETDEERLDRISTAAHYKKHRKQQYEALKKEFEGEDQ